MDELRSRLVASGAPLDALRFVPKKAAATEGDCCASTAKAAAPPASSSSPENGVGCSVAAPADDDDRAEETIVEVKTLIWEAVRREKPENANGRSNEDDAKEGRRRLFFAAALRADDRIDEEALLMHVLASTAEEEAEGVAAAETAPAPYEILSLGEPTEETIVDGDGETAAASDAAAGGGLCVSTYIDDDGVLWGSLHPGDNNADDDDKDADDGPESAAADISIRLAEQADAESLTGCESGSIPPFGHVTAMPLYLDEALLLLSSSQSQSQNGAVGGKDDVAATGASVDATTTDVNGALILSVGSGCHDHALRLPLSVALELAAAARGGGRGGGGGVRICPIAVAAPSKEKAASGSAVETRAASEGVPRQTTAKSGNRRSPPPKPQKSLAKRLRDAAGKRGKVELVRELIEEAGEDFPELMAVGEKANCTKNPLHLAAWKGDLASIDLLLDAGLAHGLDLLNAVSTGIGNYGKTPVFYALTQDRDDAVLHLVERGANLLIVNNKGQSPCSMSASHLSKGTKEIMCAAEAEQIRKGGRFVDYRASNSDGRRYGDLEPRVPIDAVNMGDDVAEELEVFKRTVRDAIIAAGSNGTSADVDDATGDVSGEVVDVDRLIETGDVCAYLPPAFAPRSVRVTTAEIRKARVDQARHERLKGQGKSNRSWASTVPTTTVIEICGTEIRRVLPRKQRWRCGSEGGEGNEECAKGGEENTGEVKEASEERSAAKEADAKEALVEEQSIEKDAEEKRIEEAKSVKEDEERQRQEQRVVDIADLPVMTLTDLFSPDAPTDYCPDDHVIVDSMEGIETLTREIDASLEMAAARRQHEPADNQVQPDAPIVASAWGLDCEWKPTRASKKDNPVATLQLSTRRRSFLVDLQTLCAQRVRDPATPPTEAEGLLSAALSRLLSDPASTIVGFGVGQDIAKLAVSYPHLPCFRLFESVVDLECVARNVNPNAPRHYMSSLVKATAILLGRRLDKTQQCSDWGKRPLSAEQVEYALLDAAVLPRLLGEVMSADDGGGDGGGGNPLIARYRGRFFGKHPHLLSSSRFTVLDGEWMVEHSADPKEAYMVEKGSVKRILALYYARQTWNTGAAAPGAVEKVPLEKLRRPREAEAAAAALAAAAEAKQPEKEVVSKKEKAEGARRDARRQKSMIRLTTLSAVEGALLPKPGSFLGYTKDTCVSFALGTAAAEALTEEHYLGFNRRGGIIEMGNAWLLFINFGAGKTLKRFQNTFRGDGRNITFSVNPGKDLDWSMLNSVAATTSADGPPDTPPSPTEETVDAAASAKKKRLLLFIRPSANSEFLFCGECVCIGVARTENGNGFVNLVLDLVDFNALVREEKEGGHSAYSTLISHHKQNLAAIDSLVSIRT